MTLIEIYNQLAEQGYQSDKNTVHSYLDIYDKILEPYRHSANNVLEIGLFKGDSLRLWERYFTTAKVYGIDCDERPHGGLADLRPMIADGTHNIVIGDATSEADVHKYFGDIKWNVLIEDSSHDILAQLQIFSLFKNRMAKGGVIIFEDIQYLDRHNWLFKSLKGDFTMEIIDRRKIKNRYDDVVIVFKF